MTIAATVSLFRPWKLIDLPQLFNPGSPLAQNSLPLVQALESGDTLLAKVEEFPTPVRIAVLDDKSASTNNQRIERLTVEMLEPLLTLLQASGGDIAYGHMCDDSNRPLTRQRFAESPILALDQLKNPVPPKPPDETSINPMRLPELQQAYQQDLADYHRQKTEDSTILDTHEQTLATHEQTAREKIQTYQKTLTPLLETRAGLQLHRYLGGCTAR